MGGTDGLKFFSKNKFLQVILSHKPKFTMVIN